MTLTHRREPLRTGIVGEVGKVFRKKRCGLQKGVVVAQIKRIIWGIIIILLIKFSPEL